MSILDSTPAPSRLRYAAALALAVFCGGLVALQSRVNGQLGRELGDGFIAAVISFGSGLMLLSIIVAAAPRGRAGLRVVASSIRRRSIPWWYAAGGVAGGFFVLSQGLTAAVLGIALFTIAIVAGQTISGMIIDARGLGTVRATPVTASRLVGAVMALVAVGVAVSPELRGDIPVWMLTMPLLVGLALGWQQAVNGQIKTVSNSALTATFINFVGGTGILVVLAAIHTMIFGWPKHIAPEPWLYLGGVIGTIFIAGFAAVIRMIGVLMQSLCAIAGQLLMSLLLDEVAPTSATALAAATIAGTVLALIAVVVSTLPWRRRQRTPRQKNRSL